MRTLDYVKCLETPDWNNVAIYLDGLKSTLHWIEVNAAEGWGIKYSEPFEQKDDDSGKAKTERVEGDFEINILYSFEIHLDYRTETISEARQKMEDVVNALSRLGRPPDSNCLSFNDPDDQEEYEKILSSL